MKILKYALYAIAGLLALVVLAIVVLVLTFDPNQYKGELAKIVKEKTGRTLAVEGTIGLTLYPSLGVAVGKTTLSEPNSEKTFAKIDEVKASVAVLPLLSRQVVIDRVILSGLDVDLVRDKDGKTNFADLAGAGEPPARAKAPEGKAAPPAPKSERVQLNVAGIEVKASSASWTDESTGNRFKATIDRLETGRIASGVPGKLSLAMRLEATQPKADYKVDLSGQYLLSLEKQSYALSGMELRVADAAPDSKKPPLTLKGDVEFDTAPQAIRFTLAADQVNLDRYLPPPDKTKAPTAGGTSKSEPERPIDLSGLKGLNMKGDLKIGQLIASNVKLENVHLGVKAAGGKVVAEPLTADLYQGKLSGAASVDANTNHFAMKSDLAGVALGPLLKDALNNEMLEGKGNVALDVQTSGNLVSAMKKALAGTASLNMKDAALKGVNLQEEIEKAKSLLRSKSAPPQAAQGSGRTDLSEVSATFVIKNGVAHNDDLSAKAPLFRLSGAGDVNIGANTIDYLAKVSIVASTAGQGGKDVGDLSGATIPVKIGGALDDPKISVDWNAFLRDTGKQLLQKQGKEQLKKQEDKLKERLQDRLKNFLGR